MKYILATTISTLALIVIIPIHALAQLPLLPMQDPQRFNDHRDARTQAAINLENTMLKSAAQADLVGDTAKHNAAILLNNMAVCYNAARNGDNLTSAICDPLMIQIAADVNATPNTPNIIHLFVDNYLKIRGIQ